MCQVQNHKEMEQKRALRSASSSQSLVAGDESQNLSGLSLRTMVSVRTGTGCNHAVSIGRLMHAGNLLNIYIVAPLKLLSNPVRQRCYCFCFIDGEMEAKQNEELARWVESALAPLAGLLTPDRA